jgi:hypothetical protein
MLNQAATYVSTESPVLSPFSAPKSLEVPVDWSMKTPQGNQAMRRKGESLLRNLSKAKEKQENLSAYVHAFEKYLSSYVKGCDTKTCGEGKDKKVKGKIYTFITNAAKVYNVDESTVAVLWSSLVG